MQHNYINLAGKLYYNVTDKKCKNYISDGF